MRIAILMTLGLSAMTALTGASAVENEPSCDAAAARAGIGNASRSLRPTKSMAQGINGHYVDVASNETRLSAALPPQPDADYYAVAYGTPDGRVCVVDINNFTLVSHYSETRGQTFLPPKVIAGASGQAPVSFLRGTQVGSTIYLALSVLDPDGGKGLQLVRSDDTGMTWSPPVWVFRATAHRFEDYTIGIDADPNGNLAIAVADRSAARARVYVSADHGATWQGPTSFAGGESFADVLGVDVAVRSGNVYLAYSAPDDWYQLYRLYVTRSLDGGATFSPPVSLEPQFDLFEESYVPDIFTAEDGSVLMAFLSEDYNESRGLIRVLRSTNGGETFSPAFSLQFDQSALTNINQLFQNRRLYDGALPDAVLLHYIAPDGTLAVNRSGDNGASFGSATILSATRVVDNLFAGTQVARTAAGAWAVAWWGISVGGSRAGEVFVRTSPDDGVTWNAVQQASTPGAMAGVVLYPVVGATQDDAIVAWEDSRLSPTRDIFAAVSRVDTPTFGTDPDFRVDEDFGTVPPAGTETMIATDGDSRVYTMFRSDNETICRVSTDRGSTFGAPVALPLSGTLRAIAAAADGYVHAIATATISGVVRVHYNRSADGGKTWLASEIDLGGPALSSHLDLAAAPGGKVYVAWSSGNDIFLARSLDGGETFDTRDVDQNDSTSDRNPRVCANGSRLVLVWTGRRVDSTLTVLGASSVNAGETLSPVADLRPSVTTDPIGSIDLSCGDGADAVAVWTETGDRFVSLLSNRIDIDDAIWGSDVATVTGGFVNSVRVVHAGPSPSAIVVTSRIDNNVFAFRSTDGGRSFSNPVRVDTTVPDPNAPDGAPEIATDRLGKTWIAWRDLSFGLGALVAVNSQDGGATWSRARRLNREQPQAAYTNTFQTAGWSTAAVPGVGVFVWGGQRSSQFTEPLFNVHGGGISDHECGTDPELGDCDNGDLGVYPRHRKSATESRTPVAGLGRRSSVRVP